jgi:hypothetical protein
MAIGPLVVLFLREARMNLGIPPATSRPGPGRWVRDGTESCLKPQGYREWSVSGVLHQNQPVGGGEASRLWGIRLADCSGY